MPINKHDQQQTQQQRVMRKSKEQQSPVGAHPDVIIQRAIADPTSLSTGDVLQLQRTIGNRRTVQLLRGNVVQRSSGGDGGGMTVTPHNDQGEMEANQISEQVIGNLLNRQVDFDSFGDDGGMHVQRSTEGVIQRAGPGGPEIGLEGGTTSSDLAQQIKSLSGGQPFSEKTQRLAQEGGSPSMKGGRVFQSPKVDKMLDSAGAIAMTHENKIMRHTKAPPPDTMEGLKLDIHENVHRFHQGATE